MEDTHTLPESTVLGQADFHPITTAAKGVLVTPGSRALPVPGSEDQSPLGPYGRKTILKDNDRFGFLLNLTFNLDMLMPVF